MIRILYDLGRNLLLHIVNIRVFLDNIICLLCNISVHNQTSGALLYLTIRLCARDFYEVIVDEEEGRINYQLIEIESE